MLETGGISFQPRQRCLMVLSTSQESAEVSLPEHGWGTEVNSRYLNWNPYDQGNVVAVPLITYCYRPPQDKQQLFKIDFDPFLLRQ
jgi:hypothetical protein